MPYKRKQIEEAEEMSQFVIEDGKNSWKVPSSKAMKILRFNPHAKIDEKLYYYVDRKSKEPSKAFHCICSGGTVRTEQIEKDGYAKINYCKHVLAVIIFLVRTRKLPKYWLRPLYGEF